MTTPRTVDNAINYIRGITFKPDELVDVGAEDAVVCMRTKNVQQVLDESDLIAVPKHLVRDPAKYLRPGDILISSANSWELVGKCSYVDSLTYPATAGGFISIIRAKPNETHPRFLFHWLNSPRVQHVLRNLGRQTTNISNLNVNRFKKLEFPAIDFQEQRRVGTILDKADGVRRKRERALAIADELLKAVFLDMFGDPVLNQKGFPTIALGDLIKVSSGNGLTAKNMDSSGKFPVYGGNGINGYHSEFMFEESQIVIGRVGVYCGAIHVTQPKSWVTDNALYVREYKRPVNRTYFEWVLRFANLNQYADRAAQPLISGGRIYPIEIVFPGESEQRAFAHYAERHAKLRNLLEDDCAQAAKLFASASQRAFRGDL